MPELRERVTASLTQSRIGASLTMHIRQISPASTSCISSTSPVSRSTTLATPASGISTYCRATLVLLRLLRHQADVGDSAHRCRIEGAVGLTEVDDFLIMREKVDSGFTALVSLSFPSAPYILPPRGSSRASRRPRSHCSGNGSWRFPGPNSTIASLGALLVAGARWSLADLVALCLSRQRLDLCSSMVDHQPAGLIATLTPSLVALLSGLSRRRLSLALSHSRVRTRSGRSPPSLVCLYAQELITLGLVPLLLLALPR